MSSTRWASFLVSVSITLVAIPDRARAQPPPDGVELSLGVGAIVSPRPYVDLDSEVFPIPILGIRYKTFFFEGVRTGFRGRPVEHLELSAFLAARFDGFDADVGSALEGMDEPSISADLGFSVAGTWDHVEVGLTVLTDVLDESDGQELDLEISFPVRRGSWSFEPSITAEYWSDDLVDHYFGVADSESRPGRPAYLGEETVNLGVGFSLNRRWRSGWMFLLGLDWKLLGDEITESPIVADDDVLSGFVGLTYTF
ncbi:MAG: MipA/OmpV family protein [Acidobacteriota bacterium]